MQVQPLVGELRSYMPWNTAKGKKKEEEEEQYQQSEKAVHRMRENTCKSYMTRD